MVNIAAIFNNVTYLNAVWTDDGNNRIATGKNLTDFIVSVGSNQNQINETFTLTISADDSNILPTVVFLKVFQSLAHVLKMRFRL